MIGIGLSSFRWVHWEPDSTILFQSGRKCSRCCCCNLHDDHPNHHHPPRSHVPVCTYIPMETSSTLATPTPIGTCTARFLFGPVDLSTAPAMIHPTPTVPGPTRHRQVTTSLLASLTLTLHRPLAAEAPGRLTGATLAAPRLRPDSSPSKWAAVGAVDANLPCTQPWASRMAAAASNSCLPLPLPLPLLLLLPWPLLPLRHARCVKPSSRPPVGTLTDARRRWGCMRQGYRDALGHGRIHDLFGSTVRLLVFSGAHPQLVSHQQLICLDARQLPMSWCRARLAWQARDRLLGTQVS